VLLGELPPADAGVGYGRSSRCPSPAGSGPGPQCATGAETTVFNYFPVKEALVMDRLEAALVALSAGLADPALTPVQAAPGSPRSGA